MSASKTMASAAPKRAQPMQPPAGPAVSGMARPPGLMGLPAQAQGGLRAQPMLNAAPRAAPATPQTRKLGRKP